MATDAEIVCTDQREAALGIDESQRRYRERELSPVEAVDAVAAAIERAQPALNAFVTLCLDRARAEAEDAERRFAAGEQRPLEGIPIAVKDLLDTEGVRTTYGSSIFGSHVPDADAEAVRRARAAGAIVVGKTATHEFAWGITCDNPHYGPCRNPWDHARISGGSSGGSAAALGAGLVALALGSDTGGSIRIPAAFCGVTGLKLSYGRVDASGTFPLAPSLDHVGAMALRPRDAWRLGAIIAGTDPDREAPAAGAGLSGLRLANCPDLHGAEPSDDIGRALASTLAIAGELGATVDELDFPVAGLISGAFVATQRAEALDSHRRHGLFPERASEYGADVRARLEQATEITLRDYLQAAADRARIDAAFADLFTRADLLLTPVSPVAPVPVGETETEHRGGPADFRALVIGATCAQNLAGLPACTLRAGFDADGLPIGLQITGPKGGEARVVAAAEELYEATRAIQDRRPEPQA